MTTLKRPTRLFSFGDFAKAQPRDPPPGDRLDAQFIELIEAIRTTQAALADIRRADGGLRNALIASEQLSPNLQSAIVGDIEARLAPIAQRVAGTAAAALVSEQAASLFAKDAEAAVGVSQQLTSGMAAIRDLVQRAADDAMRAAKAVDTEATSAENWADYAQAQAENAIAAKDEALQWAEYLAGPVVNPADAPAYIAGSKFPNGYYYQPVQGAPGGLWSAKWWAIYAQNLVGALSLYYLGGWVTPPLPGMINPDTGEMVPDPLAPGSLYYDLTTHTLYVWDGSEWEKATALAPAYQDRYLYNATTNGQTVFSGLDANGIAPAVAAASSDVHLNGVRLVDGHDFTVDAPTNTLTLTSGVEAGSVIQWDLLVPPGALGPGAVDAYKIQPLVCDGVTQTFVLKYVEPVGGTTIDANVGDGAQLLVSLDGIVQEPGVDFTATGSSLFMQVVPPATGHLWAIWYKPVSTP